MNIKTDTDSIDVSISLGRALMWVFGAGLSVGLFIATAAAPLVLLIRYL